MKLFNMRILIYMGLLASFLLACQGDPMNTPPNATGNIVSVAINSSGVWLPTPLAVDASTTEAQYDLIQVTLSSPAGPATEDIHITMVPAPDSLDSYNPKAFDKVEDDGTITPHPELYYQKPGAPGAPAFTLLDNGVVTIPKGSYVGYLKIKTTSANYLGATSYAYAYRIASVQESGYTVSANNGYSITPFLAKNPWDGVYTMGGSMGRYSGGGVPLNDGLDGPMKDGLTTDVVTTGLTTDDFAMYWANGGGVGGVGNTATPRITINPDNTIFLTIVDGGATPANWGPIPGLPNNYDPATKTFNINWKWGASAAVTADCPGGTIRAMYYKLKYKESR